MTGARAGARSKADVSANVVGALESGCVESRTHIEQMCISFDRLMATVFPELPSLDLDSLPFIQRFRRAGESLRSTYGLDALLATDYSYLSDTVRGWQAMAVGMGPETLGESLRLLEPFADDHHFAVREWAWLAVRQKVVERPGSALTDLQSWRRDSSPRIRRFAVEVTRPRSVWGLHVREFKLDPELAEPMLTSVICDDSSYVQDSVANWINDVVPSRPDWVASVTTRWLSGCECDATARIVRRGTRRLS